MPKSAFLYWLPDRILQLLKRHETLGGFLASVNGSRTGDNDRYTRFFWEVDLKNDAKPIWRTYAKGGPPCRWIGLDHLLVDWSEKALLHYRESKIGRWTEEVFWSRPAITFSKTCSDAFSARFVPHGISDYKGPCLIAKNRDELIAWLAVLNTHYVGSLVTSFNPTNFKEVGDVFSVPFSQPRPELLDELKRLSSLAIERKRTMREVDMLALDFDPERLGNGVTLDQLMLRAFDVVGHSSANLADIHGLVERLVWQHIGLSEEEPESLHIPVSLGWLPIVEEPTEQNETVRDERNTVLPMPCSTRRVSAVDGAAAIKRAITELLSESSGEKESESEEDDDSKLGSLLARPVTESLFDEIAVRANVHPISAYCYSRQDYDGLVRAGLGPVTVQDLISVRILRMLGHQWPRQIERKERLPDWGEDSGIIPITEGTGQEALIARVRKGIAADFGSDRVSVIEREFEEILGVSLETWVARDFFRNHISQYRKRPIAWHLQSISESVNASKGKGAKRRTRAERAPSFSCLIYYHRLDDQLLGAVRTQRVRPMRLRMETELNQLEHLNSRTPEQEERRAELLLRIEELKDFETKLEVVETDGFESKELSGIAGKETLDKWTSPDGKRNHPRDGDAFLAQEKRYDPDINDGVRVNIAPLQKSGLLAADVLAAKDLDKAISDRAEWRADERRWCREGKLPRPGWWKTAKK
jgi:hypothetical protein